MQDVIIGVVIAAIGALLCFRGYVALRVVIAVWGSLAGFLLGAGLVAGVTGEGFLASAAAWAAGVLLAIVFGAIAYLYYAVSVVVGMGAIGFTLGTTVMVALGVTWSWLIILVGLAAAALLALMAAVGDLPMLILAILGAFAGASAIITGVLLMIGTLNTPDLAETATTGTLDLAWWWSAAYLGLALTGLVMQLGLSEARRGTLREAWA